MEEILDLLKQNARLSTQDIAAMTKRTTEEVAAIIAKLEADGVILMDVDKSTFDGYVIIHLSQAVLDAPSARFYQEHV